MSRKGEVIEKRFHFADHMWRLLVEGRIVRVDMWFADGDDSDWSVVIGGSIVNGEIPEWTIISEAFMPPIPSRLGYVAYQHLLKLALVRSGDDEASDGTPEMIEQMIRAKSAAECRGVFKVAARKIGVSVAEYQMNRQNGKRWCYLGRHWVPDLDLYPSGKCRDCGAAEYAAAKAQERIAA